MSFSTLFEASMWPYGALTLESSSGMWTCKWSSITGDISVPHPWWLCCVPSAIEGVRTSVIAAKLNLFMGTTCVLDPKNSFKASPFYEEVYGRFYWYWKSIRILLTRWPGRSFLICYMASLMYFILFVMYTSLLAIEDGSWGSSAVIVNGD